MHTISSFLDNLRKKLGRYAFGKKTIIDTIAAATGITLTERDIEIRGNIIWLVSTLPIFRNEIFLKKSEILKTLQAAGIQANDIR